MKTLALWAICFILLSAIGKFAGLQAEMWFIAGAVFGLSAAIVARKFE